MCSRAVPHQGLERQWSVGDRGEIWIVELGAQGKISGGIRVAILERHGRVLGHASHAGLHCSPAPI